MDEVEQLLDPRRWRALVVILAASFMVTLDTFILNVAIPSIRVGLQASFAQVELVIAGYTLAYAVLLVTGGRLGDLYGRKKLFLLGMLGFTLTSFLGGLSLNATILIIARVLQGLSAAMMVPQVLVLIQITFPRHERGIALGFYGATLGVASIAAQIFGGFLISSDAFGLGWRNVFLVNVPIGILAMLAALFLLRESTSGTNRRLDLVGVGLLTGGLLLLTYPLVEGHDAGWPLWTFICIILSIPVLGIFVFYESRLTRRGGEPLIPLALFQERVFDTGIITALTFYGGNAALFFVLALYLQIGLGFSALSAGLTYLPLGVGFAVFSLIAPRLVPFLGVWMIRIGTLLMLVGELWTLLAIQHAGTTGPGVSLFLSLFVVGVGQGSVAVLLIQTVLAGIQPKRAGAASGVLTTATQTANMLGVAIIGIVFFSALGKPVAAHPLPISHIYGHAFAMALIVISILGAATLLGILLLTTSRRERRNPQIEATPTNAAVGANA